MDRWVWLSDGRECEANLSMTMRLYSDWISDAVSKIYVYTIVRREKTNVRALLMTAR